MRHLLPFAAVFLLACPPPPSARVGLVDGARLVRTSRPGQAIRARVQKEGDRLTVELEKQQKRAQALAAEVAALQKRVPKTDPGLRKKEAALRKAREQLHATHLKYRQELNTFGERLLKDFKERVRRVVMRLRSERGLDLVIMTSRGEEQGLWIWPVTDITDEVVKRLDREE